MNCTAYEKSSTIEETNTTALVSLRGTRSLALQFTGVFTECCTGKFSDCSLRGQLSDSPVAMCENEIKTRDLA